MPFVFFPELSDAVLEALGEEAPRMARIAESNDARGIAEAAEGVLSAPMACAAMLARAAAFAARQDWGRTVDSALGLLRAAMVRAKGSTA